MTKFSLLRTHWTPEEAHTVLNFLDDLRETIWATYGSDITEHCYEQHVQEYFLNR